MSDSKAAKLLNEKQRIEIEKQKIEIMLKDLEEKKEEINKYFLNLSSKICFISLQINNKLCGDILIKLYHDAASLTCEYFRSICIGTHRFNYENSTFDYFMSNTFIKGGEVSIYTPDGKW